MMMIERKKKKNCQVSIRKHWLAMVAIERMFRDDVDDDAKMTNCFHLMFYFYYFILSTMFFFFFFILIAAVERYFLPFLLMLLLLPLLTSMFVFRFSWMFEVATEKENKWCQDTHANMRIEKNKILFAYALNIQWGSHRRHKKERKTKMYVLMFKRHNLFHFFFLWRGCERRWIGISLNMGPTSDTNPFLLHLSYSF